MAERDEVQNQDDELDVEELEEVAGGNPQLDEAVNNTGCPTNENCRC